MLKREFFNYVSRNVASMVGISIYILADTFFISLSGGADGITVLNLALPLYGLIFGIGSMIGIGAATRWALRRCQGAGGTEGYFVHAIFWQSVFSLPFMLLGLLSPQTWLILMGGDPVITALGRGYVQIVLIGTPIFMVNYTFTAFTRNDDAPTIAMAAALSASAFNIVFDYLFVFPCGMGVAGAALATAMSPALSSLICCRHICGKRSSIIFRWMKPSFGLLISCCKLGVSALIGELSSAVTTTVFNFLLLTSVGNIGVAAYGVVANLSLVAMAIFNGLSQGMQPLISSYYGRGRNCEVGALLKMGLLMVGVLELLLIAAAWGFTVPLAGMFNNEGSALLAQYAEPALRLYFLGFTFAGVNSVLVTYFSAIGEAFSASAASLLRGVVAIVICAVVMAAIWGINGIWLSFLAAEAITFGVVLLLLRRNRKRDA